MEDKQIIYNCPHISLTDWGTYACKLYNPRDKNCLVKGGNCDSNISCPYKQFRAKEQECEELKDKLNCCFCNPYVELNDTEKQRKCVEVTECFRRQLDQLKAENDKLMKQHQADKGLITSTGKMNYQLLQEYDKLKTENKRFKETLDELFKIQYKLADNNKKLRQCLTEIKEIAEHCIKQDICTTCDNSDKCHIEDEEIPTYDVCKLILQIINECEGNDGN